MDIASTFKAEVFRPVAVLVIPGAIASFPYFMLATKYFPDLAHYRDTFVIPYYAISLLLVIAVGLLLEDIGSLIEAEFWDKWLETEYEVAVIWQKYLASHFDQEKVGQRYIRSVLLRLQFELGCSLAFVPFLLGFAWLNAAFPLVSWCSYALLAVFVIAIGAYLLWESYRGARVLARTRRLILGMPPERAEP
jgi:hypothetical protein